MLTFGKYCVLVFGGLLLLSHQYVCADTIKMGYFQHQPHQYIDDEAKPKGATIKYFEIVAKKMGYEVEWVGPLPFARMM